MTMTMGFDTTSAAPSPSTETAGTESRDAMMRGAIVQQSNPSSCAVSETFSPIESPKLRPLVCPAAPNYPAYPSSLPYTTVRDFAYPVTHPLHYGPPPRDPSREQDGSQAHGSGGARREGGGERDGPCSPPDWNPDAMYDNTLPSTSYGDGPPYSEDEDLHSPILITTRRRKSRGGDGAGGEYDPERGIFVSNNGDGTETYYVPDEDTIEDGPGGEYVTYDDWPEDDSRLSRDFHFAITSPDEEMHGKAIALFDFQSMHENELPLHEGQVILVSYRHGEGWLVAEDPKSGESGLVPEAYVRLARHIEGGLNSLNEEQEQEQEQAESELENRREERESVGEKALQHQDDGLDENEEQPADGDEKYQQQPPHQPQPQDEPHHNDGDSTNNPPKPNEERRVEADDPSPDDKNVATR